MEIFIVHILKRSTGNPEEITGYVEKPENESRATFRNFGEFMKIFTTPDLAGAPNKRKQVLEQRQYRRFLMEGGTVIFNTVTDLGEITDISMGGLSYTTTNMITDCPETTEITILCGAENKNIRNVKCRRVDNSDHYHTEKARRFRLAFVNPTSQQKALLEDILQECTKAKA